MAFDSDEAATRLRYYVLLREAFVLAKHAKQPRSQGQQTTEQARLPRPSASARDSLPCSQVYQRVEDLPDCIREHYRAAGILPFARNDGEVLVLLGQEEGKTKRDRDRGAHWTAFGGKREGNDTSLEYTAVREFIEETGGSVFARQEQALELKLRQTCSPVLWLKDALYCLFFLQIPFLEFTVSWIPSSSSSSASVVSTSTVHDRRGTPLKNPCHEKCAFEWMPLSNLQDLVSPTTTDKNTAETPAAVRGEGDEVDSTTERQRSNGVRLAGYFYCLLALPGALTTLASFCQKED